MKQKVTLKKMKISQNQLKSTFFQKATVQKSLYMLILLILNIYVL